MSTRSDLMIFHRQMVCELRLELEKYTGRLPRSLQRYYQDYRQEFLNFTSISSMPELIQRILECHIVYCGDYHTLRQAQMTNLSLLNKIIGKRKIILATE